MTELVPVDAREPHVPANRTLFNQSPTAMLAFATEAANVLRDVIDKQKLYTLIQGKPHVRVEGWTTMGSFIGVLPHEKWVKELPDGSYEAMVELVRESDGRVLGAASALCSVEERRWKTADKNARRSMAITRATGKAFRLSFSWIMSLAGYEPTPAEEMHVPEQPHESESYTGTAAQKRAVWEALKAGDLTEYAALFVRTFTGKPMASLGSEIKTFQAGMRELRNESVSVDASSGSGYEIAQ